MIGWKAWFTEGREYRSSETDWDELPDDGVLAVLVFEDEKRRRYCDGQDWYFMWKGTICCNNDSLTENRKRYPGAVFKRGKWTSDADMERIQKEADQCRSS